jgi:hypothetical protein
MSFLLDLVVAALAVTLAAGLGLLITLPVTDRPAQASASRERGEAAAGDFYCAYGGFFAIWKA